MKNKKSKHGSNKAKAFKKDLRKEILSIFKSNPRKPLNHKQVSSTLGIKDGGIRGLIQAILDEEVTTGKLIEESRGKYLLAKVEQSTIEGTIQITRFGRGFLIVDGNPNDIPIPKGETGTALWGDRVEVVMASHARKPKGRVVSIVKRARKQYVGIMEMGRRTNFAIPTDQKIHIDFFIPEENLNGAEQGQKVVIEIESWDDAGDSPIGRIVEVLGQPGDNNVEMHAILVEFGLPYAFDDEVLSDADKIPKEITQTDVKARRDMRKVTTFTIDPADAKDFDDALSVQQIEDGNWEVGVHIADVSHYLQPGTVLDDEAFERATSVYLVDRTIPMLPEVLSNELCSLRPNEDKLCFSAVFELDENGVLKKEWFGRTVIHSDRRFSYEEAQDVIESGKGDFDKEILQLDKMAKQMRKARFQKGGIDFNTEEVKFNLAEDGKPLGVYIKAMKDSNKLIEDFMLLANTRVASAVGNPKKGDPKTFVYRVHDKPDPEKLNSLRQFALHFGYRMPAPTVNNAEKLISDLLKEVQGKPEEDTIKVMAIRSMAKAEYSTNNLGHFGLAFDFYSHFTSPIRRYPDVMVHRLLQRYLDGGSSVSEEAYESKCRHSSEREKRAAEAERASIKYKQVEFLMSKVGEHFEGVVSGLTDHGIYVELTENKCEGRVSVELLRDDFYRFDQERYELRGQKSGKTFQLGDKLEIKVVGADLMKRQLDFEFIQKLS
jgi:ribonuclease R